MKSKKNNESFNKYIEEVFNPANDWAKSEVGRIWIRKHIPSLHALRPREKEVMAAVYAIYINGICIYIGQSLRAVKRLYVHAYNMAFCSFDIFGMTKEEIEKADIVFKIMTPPLLNEIHRLAAEAAAVRTLKPIFQPYFLLDGLPADYCLPRSARRNSIIDAGVVKGGKSNE